MKTASAAFVNLLNGGGPLLIAELLTLTTATGSIYRYANSDIDLTISGNVFTSHDIRFKRGKVKTEVGVTVDEMDLDVYADPTNLIGSVPFFQALGSGALDWARVKVERLVTSSWSDMSPGTIIIFSGRLADVQMGRSQAQLKVKSDLELLNITMPRNVYQPGCIHTLFDTGCDPVQTMEAAKAVAGAVAASPASTVTTLYSALAQATGYFDLGKIVFTSGANSGVTRNVKTYINGSPGSLLLSYPLPHAPASGDTFTVYPGCDHAQATCTSKFSNLVHFRGFPYVPNPESGV